MLMLLATGMLQRFGDLIVGGVVLALVAYGVQNGLFLAVLAGMHALVSLVVALAFAEPLAAMLTSFEVPQQFTFPAAFGLLLLVSLVGIRLAVGAMVPQDTVRFMPMVDKIGGGIMGWVAGMVAAGTLLIAFSIAPVPEAFGLDGSKLRYDLGTRMLRTFARCVEPDEAKRAILLSGEQPPKSPVANGPFCSEPFVDSKLVDGKPNGMFDGTEDPKERYLDEDGSGSFTPSRPFEDVNGNGRRDIGLLEYYRLGIWRNVRVMHSPVITSSDSVTVAVDIEDGANIYQAAATDLDPGDIATYAIRVLPHELPAAAKPPADPPATDKPATDKPATDKPATSRKAAEKEKQAAEAAAAAAAMLASLLVIEPTTGVVTVPSVANLVAAHEPLEFVLTVTDQQGLTAEKTVTVHHKGVGKKKSPTAKGK